MFAEEVEPILALKKKVLVPLLGLLDLVLQLMGLVSVSVGE